MSNSAKSVRRQPSHREANDSSAESIGVNDAAFLTRGRRIGRDALLDAGTRLLRRATLAQLLGFASARGVARESDVTIGTVTHHFTSGAVDHDSTTTRAKAPLGAALAGRALELSRSITETTGIELLAEIERIRRGDRTVGLARMADIAARDLVGHIDDEHDESAEVAFYACCAAAPHDQDARTMLTSRYETTDALVRDFCDLTCDALGHHYVDGVDGTELARGIIALSDGLLIRSRFAPSDDLSHLFADLTVRLMLATTTPGSPALEHVRSLSELLDLPDGSHLDPHKRQAIVAATTATFHRSGWDGVTIPKVAREANVSGATIATHFGSQGGLAAIIWSQYLPSLQDEIEADRRRSFRNKVRLHLRRVAELSMSQPALTVALLRANLDYSLTHPAPSAQDPSDPRNIAPVHRPLMEALRLAQQKNTLRRNIAESDLQAYLFATLLTNRAMELGATRPEMTPDSIADNLDVTVVMGALKRRTHL